MGNVAQASAALAAPIDLAGADYRLFFDQAELAMAIADAETGELLDVNIWLARLVKREPAALIGQHQRILHPPTDSAGQFSSTFERHRRDADSTRRRAQLLSSDGELREVEIFAHRIRLPDRDVVHGIFHDITERERAAERQAELNSKLVQAQRMEGVGHVAGGMAHNFNNLLTIIAAAVDLVSMRTRGDPELSEVITDIRRAVREGGEITGKLMRYARPGPPDLRIVPAQELVSDLVALARRALPLNVLLNVELTSAATVRVDVTELHQAILNVLNNAQDAMGEGGRLTVRCVDRALIDSECPDCGKPIAGEVVDIEISDTGPGIAPEHLPRLFDPFFSTKPPGKGTGLGLPVATGIVSAHGGHLHVRSVLGAGATFVIRLPAHRSSNPSPGDGQP